MNLKEARASNSKHYNGRPCKNCQSTLKFTVNQSCVACTTQRTKDRDPEVYKRYIKSEKGQKWLKEFRRSETWHNVQNRWRRDSGFGNEQQARRRKQIVDSYDKLADNDKLRIKEIYAEAARLSCETGIMHHVDHTIPLFEGGQHHPSNLQILTDEEHWRKCAEENKRRQSWS